jgi:hypothetical protein
MKINIAGLQDKSKQQFLIIETFQGMEPTASYMEQAYAVRRALDAVDYIEEQFQKGVVVMMHKEASSPTSYQIVAVNNNAELNDYLKANVAHARVRPNLRKVVPLTDWNSGVETFEKMITDLEALATEEQKFISEGKFRPIKKLDGASASE